MAQARSKTKASADKALATAPMANKSSTRASQTKDQTMSTKTPNLTGDYTAAIADTAAQAVAELQTGAQAAYDKGTVALAEATEFAKGNAEAVVESGKLFAEGMQAAGKAFAEEARSAYETATADLKDMAGVKSPTELFQLQGKIARRNFDALVAATSKNTDAGVKFAQEVFAPLSGRVNLAVEKFSKVA